MPTSGKLKNRSDKILISEYLLSKVLNITALSKATKRYLLFFKDTTKDKQYGQKNTYNIKKNLLSRKWIL